MLLQVCADLSDASSREREVRALLSAAAEYPDATPLLITLDAVPPQPALPAPLQWKAAATWLLDWDPIHQSAGMLFEAGDSLTAALLAEHARERAREDQDA